MYHAAIMIKRSLHKNIYIFFEMMAFPFYGMPIEVNP